MTQKVQPPESTPYSPKRYLDFTCVDFRRNETNQTEPVLNWCHQYLLTSMDEEMDLSLDLGGTAPSDVVCDACTGRKRRAEQTCLQCLASYCQNHLETHNALHMNAKRHKLVAATGRLEERVCPEHDKLMEVFCRTDQQCICHLCITNNHRSHDVVSVDFEVAEVKVVIFLSHIMCRHDLSCKYISICINLVLCAFLVKAWNHSEGDYWQDSKQRA